MSKESHHNKSKEITIPRELEQVKESPWRSVMKTISWRVIATGTTMLIAYFITGNIEKAIQIGSIEVVAKLIIYYLHERAWVNIKWGKYWSRTRLVRRMRYNYIKYKRSKRK